MDPVVKFLGRQVLVGEAALELAEKILPLERLGQIAEGPRRVKPAVPGAIPTTKIRFLRSFRHQMRRGWVRKLRVLHLALPLPS